MKKLLISLSTLFVFAFACTPKQEEEKAQELPTSDLLIAETGEIIATAQDWEQVRRSALLSLFAEQMYGTMPPKPEKLSYEVLETDTAALDGKAIRKQIAIKMGHHPAAPSANLLLYLPAGANGPFPVFLGLNFNGNQSIHSDPNIFINAEWMRPNDAGGVVNNRATEATRGIAAKRWPVDSLLAKGFGLATMYYGSLFPDKSDGFSEGIYPYFPETYRQGASAAGAITTWAWGLSRAMDYLETDTQVASGKVAVVGHSRLGKAALWAGANDQRFAIVISNNSGCGGAALSRRKMGETVEAINRQFPHWFCQNFKQYNENEEELPFDQHGLIALMAPRPVYIASAEEDLWADPEGEFLSGHLASPVYELYGYKGISQGTMPAIKAPLMERVGYHIRDGKHNVTYYDWEQFTAFASKWMP